MTDELMIQPQIQERRANPAAYGLTGAVLGAGAGYGVNAAVKHWTKEPVTSWQDIANQAKDTTDFSSNYKGEEATFNSIKAKATEIKGLENELSKLPEKTLPTDSTEAKELEAVKKEHADAIEKKVAELEKSNTGSVYGDVFKDPPKADNLKVSQLPETNLKTNKDMTPDEAKKFYNEMIGKLEREEKRFKGHQNVAKLFDKQTQYEKDINRYFADAYSRNGSKYQRALDKAYEFTHFFNREGDQVPTREFKKAQDVAFKIKPNLQKDISKLSLAQAKEFGEEIEIGAKNVEGKKSHVFEVLNKETGRYDKVRIAYTQADLNEFVNNENKKIIEERRAIAEELYTGAKEFIKDKQNDANFSKYFNKEVMNHVTAEETGYYNKSNKTVDIVKILSESNKNNYHSSTIKKMGYKSDIQVLKNAVKNSKTYKNDLSKVISTLRNDGGKALNGNYTAAGNDIEKALEMAQARQEIVNSYEQERLKLNKRLNNRGKNLGVLKDIKEKINEARNADPKLSEIRSKLAEQFPNIFTETEKSGGKSADELRKMAEDRLPADLKSKLKSKQEAYDKAIETKGVANAEARKALQDKISTANAEFEKGCKELASKFTKGAKGINPWLATGIGAVALGLAGLGIASSKNS